MEKFPPYLQDENPDGTLHLQPPDGPTRQIAEHLHTRTRAGATLAQAIAEFAEEAKAFGLPDDLDAAVRGAKQRDTLGRISPQTLRNWFNEVFPHHAADRRRMAYVLKYLGVDDGRIAGLFHVTTRTVREWRRSG